MNNWSEVLLKDICDITRGASPRPIHDFMTEDLDGIPWVKIRDATASNTRFIQNTKGFIKKEGKNKSVSVISGDLIVSNSATPGLPKIMGIDACIHDGWLLLRNLNGVCKEFLFYLLINDRKQIVSQGTGTIFTNLKTDILKNHQIKLPPISEQEEIASFLGSVDDKIELNQKMNKTLEEIAKTLFKSWFIDFDPVRAKAEGRPTGLSKEISDLFPDSFEDSELGEIPKGWEVKQLDEIADFLNGLALQKYPESEEHPKYPVLKIAQLREGSTNDQDVFSSGIPDDYIIRNGDYIFSWSASLLSKFWMGGDAALNQHLFKVTSKDYPDWFYAGWVEKHLDSFSSIASSVATSMGHIKRSDLKDAKTIAPSIQTISKLGEYFSNLRKKANLCLLENTVLSDLRDTLLPKLISGELKISDAESLIEEAGV